ncbi:hypothetical protein [Runella slithyformis]|uniref:hypothetical protein n=1 Tax=Runella slithyformis TaxID=106 RepID=UPI0003139652|nr:hypothetical protein [Runella slithyformis]
MMVYGYYVDGAAKQLFANGYALLLFTLGLGLCLHFAVPDVFSVAFFPLILLSAAYGSKNMDAFFGTKPLQRIGDWSFSIYLVHQPLMYTIATVMAYLTPPQSQGTGRAAPANGYAHRVGDRSCIYCLYIICFVSDLSVCGGSCSKLDQ